MRVVPTFALASLVGLAACSTVDTDPTVPAFANATAAGKTAFQSTQAAETQAFADAALSAALANGSVTTSNCWNAGADRTKCELVIVVNGQPIDISPVAENGQKLAAALADYGSGLQAYAAAKDITDRQKALEQISNALGNAGVPGAGPAGTFLATFMKDAELQGRRLQVLAIAKDADSTVKTAANLLQQEAVLLQKNVTEQSASVVEHEQVVVATAAPADKAAAVQALVAAVAAEHSAANLKINIGQEVSNAHMAMITSLEDPKASFTTSISQIKELQTDFESVAAAFGSPAPKVGGK